MILELSIAQVWLIVLFVLFVVACIISAWLGIECSKKNEEIASIESKTKDKMSAHFNEIINDLSNNIHSFNAEARERERQEWGKERKQLIRKLKEENTFNVKYQLGQTVYILHDYIYKDVIKEVKINKKGIFYTTMLLKDIKENDVYASFDELCLYNKIDKDDILRDSYNFIIDKNNEEILKKKKVVR
jgi:ABC-type multidrug transport system fused ATPase/permease subunit